MWLLYINTVEQKQESHIRKIHHQPPAMLSGLLGLLSCVWPGQLQAHRTRTMSWWGAGGGHGHVSPGWDEVGQGVFLQKVQLSLAYFVRSHERTRTGTFPVFFYDCTTNFPPLFICHSKTHLDQKLFSTAEALIFFTSCCSLNFDALPPRPSSAPLSQVFCRHPAAANTTGPLFSALTHTLEGLTCTSSLSVYPLSPHLPAPPLD